MGSTRKISRLHLPKDRDDLIYLAALIDCEGHIARRPPRPNRSPRWYIGVTNTHVPTMEWLETMGGSLTCKHDQGKPCYGWVVTAQIEVFELALVIRPFLRMKQEKADAAIEEIRNKHEFISIYAPVQDQQEAA